MIYLGLILIGFVVLKTFHLWPGLPGPHTWRYTHTSDEKFVAISLKANEWVDRSRPVRHFVCRGRHCGEVSHD